MKSCHLPGVDGAREYHTKQNKSVRERQTPYDFTHMWNLRNKTKKKRTNKNRLFFSINLFLREGDRAQAWEGREREGDTESKAGSRL